MKTVANFVPVDNYVYIHHPFGTPLCIVDLSQGAQVRAGGGERGPQVAEGEPGPEQPQLLQQPPRLRPRGRRQEAEPEVLRSVWLGAAAAERSRRFRRGCGRQRPGGGRLGAGERTANGLILSPSSSLYLVFFAEFYFRTVVFYSTFFSSHLFQTKVEKHDYKYNIGGESKYGVDPSDPMGGGEHLVLPAAPLTKTDHYNPESISGEDKYDKYQAPDMSHLHSVDHLHSRYALPEGLLSLRPPADSQVVVSFMFSTFVIFNIGSCCGSVIANVTFNAISMHLLSVTFFSRFSLDLLSVSVFPASQCPQIFILSFSCSYTERTNSLCMFGQNSRTKGLLYAWVFLSV